VIQFVGESMLAVAVSLVIALSSLEVLLPFFDHFLVEPIGFGTLENWRLLAAMICGAIVVGALSGIYPALVLSAFRPASSLKGSGSERTGSAFLRSMLVVAQFAISIGFGIAVITIYRQISFARALDLGFDRSDMVIVPSSTDLPPPARRRLRRILRNGPGIVGTALSNVVPFDQGSVTNRFVRPQGASSEQTTAQFLYVSPGFASLYGFRLIAGRLLSSSRATDIRPISAIHNVLINATAARHFGYSPADAIGKILIAGNMRLMVVGVLADAILTGPNAPVQPEVFTVFPDGAPLLSIRVRSDEMAAALAYIDKTWRSIAPGVALDRYFLTTAFKNLFRSDEKEGAMFAAFAGISILIACLGLFGLVVFTAERCTKEIGIRKVSGARTPDIMWLMLWRIGLPVLAANALAWPIAYYYLRHWLDGYAYRIPLSPVYFLTAGMAALFIAWATVFANTLRVARLSPVQALRYE
jgi:putative ABC transport system permease protein